MLQLTVTAKLSDVVLQDPFPSDGMWTLSVEAGHTKSVQVSWDQFQRVASQVDLLERAGFCTVTIETLLNGEVRGQENDLIGMPAIDRVSKFTLAVTGETSLVIEGDQLIAQQGIAHAVLGDVLTPTACVDFRSPTPGVQGNDLQVEILSSGAPGPVTVAVVGSVVTINLHGTIITAGALATLLNTPGVGTCRGTVFLVAQGTGLGNVLPVALTPLVGGSGEGMNVTLSGQPCVVYATLPGALPSDPQRVILDTPDLTGIAAATEAVGLYLRSGSKKTGVTVTLV